MYRSIWPHGTLETPYAKKGVTVLKLKRSGSKLYGMCGVVAVLLLISLALAVKDLPIVDAKVGGASLTFKQVASSAAHTCAIASDNRAYCWGQGTDGQLGDGSTTTVQTTPVAVSQGGIPAGATIKQITAGTSHTCAIASDNKAYCWGSAANGRLGNGTTTPTQTTPVAVSQGAMPAGATIIQISAGADFTCAIASDNKAYCWGTATNGRLGNGSTTPNQTTPVAVSLGAMPAGAMVRQISAGSLHACAIASDNKAYCWGIATVGRLGNGTTTPDQSTPVAVSLGTMPASSTIRQISASGNNTCAIASDNKAYCWGSAANGRLGNGTTTPTQTTPVAVSQGAMPAGAMVRQISASSNSLCAIASDNKAYCWGAGANGRLGNGTTTGSQTTPVAVSQGGIPAGATIQHIAIANAASCALASDNKLYCWGEGTSGQLGNGTATTSQTTPVAVAATNRPVSVSQSVFRVFNPSSTTSPGTQLAAANTTATLGSIAGEYRIRLGLSNLETSSSLDTNSIALGNGQTCAIASNHKGYCWGRGGNGQLGNGTNTASQTTPIAVSQGAMPAGASIKQFAAGNAHTCAIASDNKAYCWGQGTEGQLGNNAKANHNIPVAVSQGAMPAGATIREMSSGTSYTCAIASDNKAYCWGYGNGGRLGNGGTGDQTTPVAVSLGAMPAGATIRQISAGQTHACVVASDNKAYCWGFVEGGTLGDGSTTSSSTPIAVSLGAMPAGSTIIQISAGYDHTCAIASNNKAYCWGYGQDGALGNGASVHQNAPVAVSLGAMPAGTTIREIEASFWVHSCVTASDNKAYCWGGGDGSLGHGSTASSNTPVAVSLGAMPSTTINQVVTGGDHTCAVASNNKSYCWGNNINGGVGNGTTSPNPTTPVAVLTGDMQDTSTTISSSQLDLALQIAPQAAAPSCSAVSVGWTNVTTTSDMNWGTSPPVHAASIGSVAGDPSAPFSGGYAYQSIVQSGSFTNNQAIAPQQTGLWDVVLHDRSSKASTSYCFRIVSNTAGTSIDTYSQYPRVTTAAGSLGLQFVNNSGSPVVGSDTDTGFSPIASKGEVQSTSGTLVDISNKQLEAHNSTSNSGWNVSIAATGGPSSHWEASSGSYPYNATSSAGGQLTVTMSGSSHTAHGATPSGDTCLTANVTRGPNGTFSNLVSAITLLSGSASAQFNCSWRLRDIGLTQTIPPSQVPGSYILDMTATIVAS